MAPLVRALTLDDVDGCPGEGQGARSGLVAHLEDGCVREVSRTAVNLRQCEEPCVILDTAMNRCDRTKQRTSATSNITIITITLICDLKHHHIG